MSIHRLYLHVPFCKKKCNYCAFHSISAANSSIIDRYLDKIDRDLKASRHLFGNIRSVYIGGGTPNILSLRNLNYIFEIIKKYLHFEKDAEISIECNPEFLETDKIKLIASFANRVSIGIQTFSPSLRKIIGRHANILSIGDSIKLFQDNGVDNISCDLIYGIPKQSIESFFIDLEEILRLGIKHFSAYSLTIEENSRLEGLFTDQELNLSDIISTKIWKKIPLFLKEYGFKRYEISNYAIEGFECNHNVDAWFGGKYIGFGPTAASFDGEKRWTNGETYDWFDDKKTIYDRISSKKRLMEIFSIGLRSMFSWKISIFKKGYVLSNRMNDYHCFLTKIQYQSLIKACHELADLKLLKIIIKKEYIEIFSTKHGQLFWNEIALYLI